MHIQITRRIRSIVDTVIEVASSNPVTVPCYYIFLTLSFYQLFIEPGHVISNNVVF